MRDTAGQFARDASYQTAGIAQSAGTVATALALPVVDVSRRRVSRLGPRPDVRPVPARTITVPASIRIVTASPRKIHPQSIANTGIRNATATAPVGPSRASRRK